jgi:hypothetical protein
MLPKHTSILFLICLLGMLCFSCHKTTTHIPQQPTTQLSDFTDSTAFGEVRFGIKKPDFLKQLKTTPVENRMTEPVFRAMVTEIEGSIRIGKFVFNSYYYFDKKDALYRVSIIKHNNDRLLRNEYYKAYDTLYKHMRVKYGPETQVKSIINDKSVSWTLKNKKIELTSSCFDADCSLECKITDIGLMRKNSISKDKHRAKTYLDQKRTPAFL